MEFLNWLKKLLNTEKSDEKAPKGQTASSFENVVVGKILEINKHPNADRLRLVKVDLGNKELEVVCGATNIEIGQKVPVALVGAKLPGMSAKGGSASGGEIKEAEIRGVKSSGMLCAEDELGLGSDHNGIMILDEKAEIGMEFSEYINLNK
jgi:phenylalanyl-tRNA synthetase beta chain